jgi:hypothetical protein
VRSRHEYFRRPVGASVFTRDTAFSYLNVTFWLVLVLLCFSCLASAQPVSTGSAPICPLIGSLQKPRGRLNIQHIQWANLDLMETVVRGLGVPRGAVRIAIVDGTVTEVVNRFEGKVSIASQFPVRDASDEKYREHTDHGVAVTDTLLMAAPGSVARSWQSFDGPHSTDFDAREMIRKACNEGDLVINLSASNKGTALQYTYPFLHVELAQKGCILIEASGNDAAGPDATVHRDEGAITVGANDLRGRTAPFSQSAVVSAPGVNLQLSDAGGELRYDSGTSFAAPIVSAIVKEIYSILMRSSDFNTTTPVERIKAVKKILVESSHSDAAGHADTDVDGYRAVLLANYVDHDGIVSYIHLNEADSWAYVKKAMTQRPDLPLAKCSSLSATANCEAKIACYTQKRMVLSADPDAATPEEWLDLRDTANSSNETGLAIEWAIRLPSDNRTAESQSTPSDNVGPSLSPTTSPIRPKIQARVAGEIQADPEENSLSTPSRVEANANPTTDIPNDKTTFLGGGTLWHHNRSTVRLRADGTSRTFYYEEPRVEMEQRGVRKGTLLFQGKRVNDFYVGTAYVFTANCGPRAYSVRGPVSDRMITMTGRAPRFDTQCNQIGDIEDHLSFVLDASY